MTSTTERHGVAIVLGWLILGEAPAALAIVGGAIRIVGVAIARTSASFGLRPRAAATGVERASVP